ncbi:cytochrome P450 [Cryphonectria parasitica EP155]|uniref:Cytochrome P450 n=1 Tax=Cryphonectria parasitica (strain ATCC 38755 / EP155) TaxID=660469 RepID=A0A9P4YBZ2_CRYP1|nr:cytochrome P450 [Cryphonectria parasitica EP155]KAF3770258.1 cytochrome P450 [Cryphonectria parasitica EP155]
MAVPVDRLETQEGTISPTRTFLTGILLPLLRWWWALLPAAILLRAVYRKYASPLRKYPGPWLASYTRLWKVISTASTHTHHDHIAIHRKYGPVVRIAPDEVSLSSPEAARTLLSAGKRFYKTKFYGVFPPPENPDIFTEYREDVHAQKKKVANVPYSMAAMQQLSPFIDDTIEVLMRTMDAMASGKGSTSDPGRPIVDLGNWLHWFAFDVLGEVAFSRSFGFLEQGRDVDGAIHTIDEMQRYNGIVGQVPFMDHLGRRNPLRRLIPTMNTKNALITRMALEELERRRPFDKESEGRWRGGDGRQDLLASLIKGHLKDPQRFGEGDVFAVAHGAIFAGSDSTASTMQSFFWHVLSDPRVYAQIQHEMKQAVADGTIPASGNISWNEAQNLPYFQACLKEAMRVRPAVGLNITRIVPPEGAELDGQFFPGGVTVAVNGWVLHRDRATFGEDADVFRPERWLADVEAAKRMERYMFQFGGGSHLCIGRNLALLEINKVCPRLLRDFDFELLHPGRELEAHATFFVVQSGLEVYISKKQ